ncbi:uncharacterized protein LOC143720837 [Siphateles boraxobius]|uniref:uncharacterized protein LOC143720837 n=1 Tax=Siphateles boraxobius TaxID=180520 RepID=UPI00406418F3
MSRVVALFVVAVLLCIILSSQEADVLQCTGGRQRDGQFFFNALYEVKEDIHDCETQWLVDEKVAGLFEANGNMAFMPPIVNATANTAILQTCPEKFECLLICPNGNINEKQQCSCDATPTTTLPEVSPVGFPNWIIGVLIGASVFVVLMTVTIVLLQKRQRRSYSSGSANL